MKKHKKFSDDLGVDEDASTRTIHAMYAGLAAVYGSPGLAESPEARAKFAEIEEAYHYLLENRPVRPDLKSKHAAVLSADVSGYCRLVSVNERETLEFLGVCLEMFREAVPRFDGRIFNTAGDAVLAEFANMSDAVRCAVSIQSDLRSLNETRAIDRQMLFRVGIHAGNVFFHEGDLLGETVNLAARLQTSCAPGGISLSGNVYELANREVTANFTDLGEVTFRNQSKPVRVFHIAAPESFQEPTAIRDYTRKTSYMMSDLEKTVATAKRQAPAQPAPEPALRAEPGSLEPLARRQESSPAVKRSTAAAPAQSGRDRNLTILKWAVPATALGLLLALFLEAGPARQVQPAAEQRLPAEAEKAVQESSPVPEPMVPVAPEPLPLPEPEPQTASSPARPGTTAENLPIFLYHTEVTRFEGEGVELENVTCYPGQRLSVLYVRSAANTLEPPVDTVQTFPDNICQHGGFAKVRAQSGNAKPQYALAGAKSDLFSVAVQLSSATADTKEGYGAPGSAAEECPAGLKKLQLWTATVISPVPGHVGSNFPASESYGLLGDAKPPPITVTRQEPEQPCDASGSCAAVTYGAPKLVGTYEYAATGQYICVIRLP